MGPLTTLPHHRLDEPLGATPMARWRDGWQRIVASRPKRVLLLIVACVLMSWCDLACTLAYMSGVGMFEKNPLARVVAQSGGPGMLILFKVCTTIVMALCIYCNRRYRAGELCAWLCTLVLVSLMVHWTNYNNEVVTLSHELSLIAEVADVRGFEHWVRFE